MRVLIILMLLIGIALQENFAALQICVCDDLAGLNLCCEERINCFPSLLPDIVRQELNSSTSIIALCAEQIELTTKITFSNQTNFILSGYPNRTKISCTKNLATGFEIRTCQNIQILNVALVNCGAVHSLADTSKARKNSKFVSSIHVSDTTQLVLQNVHIISSIGKGLTMFNSYGHVEDCLFQDNNVGHREYQYNWAYGGGMYVELSSEFPHENLNQELQKRYKNLTVVNTNF